MPDHEMNNGYKTRDKTLTVILIALGHIIEGTEYNNGRVTFFFNRDDIAAHLNAWLNNCPIPIDDVRRFIIAEEIFNSHIRNAARVL